MKLKHLVFEEVLEFREAIWLFVRCKAFLGISLLNHNPKVYENTVCNRLYSQLDTEWVDQLFLICIFRGTMIFILSFLIN